MIVAGISRTLAAQHCAAFLFVAMLVGCAGPDNFGGSRHAVEAWSEPQGFGALPIGSTELPIFALTRGTATATLHVYIEGDGAAWPNPYHPPRDPTPRAPIALALAAQDPASTVAYLGRPCQYLESDRLARCPVRYWTSHRFAPEVLDSYQSALDRLKSQFGANRLILFGYSGGGVVATLLAGKRDDVERLVTIAAPLSLSDWTALHKVTPLLGSLDPAREFNGAGLPPALHFVGGRDRVTPSGVVSGFAARTGGRLREIPEFDHQCCWSRDWRRLLEETR